MPIGGAASGNKLTPHKSASTAVTLLVFDQPTRSVFMFRRTRLSTAAWLAIGGAALASTAVTAQQQQQSQQQPQRVEITGSNIKRVNAEGASPIQVITREEIERTGATTLNDILQNVASAGLGNFSETNTNLSSGGGSAGISLRGLGLSYTLVLVDGRRVAPSGFGGATGVATFTDVNSIPVGAIDRVEVLKGSASAVYGADAVGGVINIILRRDLKSGEVALNYGQTSRSDGQTTRFSGAYGFGDLGTQKFNVLATVDVFKRERIKSVDREYGRSADGTLLNPDLGIDTRSLTGNPGSFRIGTGTTNANFVPDANTNWTAMPGCPEDNKSIPDSIKAGTPAAEQYCLFNFLTFWDLSPPSDRIGGVIKGTFEISPTLTAFANVMANRNETTFNVAPTPLSQGVVPATAPGNSLGRDYQYLYRITAAGPRINEQEVDFRSISAGLRGQFGAFDWDAAYSRSQTTNSNTGRNYSNSSRIAAETAAGNLRPYEFALDPSLEAAVAARISQDYTRKGQANSQGVDFKISGEIVNQLGAGPLAMAAGVEFRKEDIFDQCLTPECYQGPGRSSVIVGANSTQAGGKRDINSQFLEFRATPLKGLDMTLAVRRDAYDGQNIPDPANPNSILAKGKYEKAVPQLSLEFRPNSAVLFRGVIGEGFKAPTLFEAYQAQSESFNNGAAWRDQRRCPTVPPAGGTCLSGTLADSGAVQVRNLRGGQPALKPETSENLSLGLVLEPVKDFSVSADVWAIYLKETIGLPSVSRLLTRERLNGGDPLVVRLPAAPSDVALGIPGRIDYITLTYANLGKTRLKGGDIDAEYRFRTAEHGRIALRSLMSYLASYKQQPEAGAPLTEFIGTYELPRFRMNNSARWTNGPWDLLYTWRHTGEHLQESQATGRDFVRPENYHDISVTYTGFKNLTLTATLRNITDHQPSFSNGDSQNYSYVFGDPRGRNWQIGAKYTF
jgi:iron complex outermembrane recepter protein